MRKTFVSVCSLVVSLIVAGSASAQDRVDITSFEDGLDWQWTGGSFLGAFVEAPDPAIGTVDGDNALLVIFDNNVGGEWAYGTFNFPSGPVDLTGMREIHMWVNYAGYSTPPHQIRLDLPGGNILGFAETPNTDEWYEMVFKIDRLTSQLPFMASVSFFNGFITPTPATALGELYIDNIFAVGSASGPVTEVMLYDFEEEDAATGYPTGWQPNEGLDALLGEGETDPATGNNYLVFFAGGGYSENVQTANTLADFDRWQDVVEILFDIRIVTSIPGGWLQSRLHINSGVDGAATVNTETKEIGYADTANDGWKTMLYEVDMSQHRDNILAPNGFLEVIIATNNDGSGVDHPIFLDNFRVAVPEGETGVTEWSVY